MNEVGKMMGLSFQVSEVCVRITVEAANLSLPVIVLQMFKRDAQKVCY